MPKPSSTAVWRALTLISAVGLSACGNDQPPAPAPANAELQAARAEAAQARLQAAQAEQALQVRLDAERAAQQAAQAQARNAAEAQQKAELEARIRNELEAKEKTRLQAEAKAKAAAEARQKAELEARIRQELETKEKARLQAEAKAKAAADAKLKAEQDARTKTEQAAAEKAKATATLQQLQQQSQTALRALEQEMARFPTALQATLSQQHRQWRAQTAQRCTLDAQNSGQPEQARLQCIIRRSQDRLAELQQKRQQISALGQPDRNPEAGTTGTADPTTALIQQGLLILQQMQQSRSP